MTSEGSNRHSFLSLVLIFKWLSKKLLLRILNFSEGKKLKINGTQMLLSDIEGFHPQTYHHDVVSFIHNVHMIIT